MSPASVPRLRRGMSADSQGNLYFGARNTGSNGAAVMKLTPSGELGMWRDGFEAYIAGVVVDTADNDNIWVILEQSGNSIIKLAINGTALLTASTTTVARRSASRAAADGSIWVAQATNPTSVTADILKISRAGGATGQHGIEGACPGCAVLARIGGGRGAPSAVAMSLPPAACRRDDHNRLLLGMGHPWLGWVESLRDGRGPVQQCHLRG